MSTAQLLHRAAPEVSERVRLIDRLEARFIAHYIMPEMGSMDH